MIKVLINFQNQDSLDIPYFSLLHENSSSSSSSSYSNTNFSPFKVYPKIYIINFPSQKKKKVETKGKGFREKIRYLGEGNYKN